MSTDPRIIETVRCFTEIYLEGIPLTIRDKSAFLSFICSLTAMEALSGYRYGKGKVERRFKDFVYHYFESPYPTLLDDLWIFRNRMIHAFSPAKFGLTHNQPSIHLQRTDDGTLLLNTENFFEAVRKAALKFFAELQSDTALQQTMLQRLNDIGNGGPIAVGPAIVPARALS